MKQGKILALLAAALCVSLWATGIPEQSPVVLDLPEASEPPEPGRYTKPSYGRYEREYARQREPALEGFLAGR